MMADQGTRFANSITRVSKEARPDSTISGTASIRAALKRSVAVAVRGMGRRRRVMYV